jgi:hypothetical protein
MISFFKKLRLNRNPEKIMGRFFPRRGERGENRTPALVCLSVNPGFWPVSLFRLRKSYQIAGKR